MSSLYAPCFGVAPKFIYVPCVGATPTIKLYAACFGATLTVKFIFAPCFGATPSIKLYAPCFGDASSVKFICSVLEPPLSSFYAPYFGATRTFKFICAQNVLEPPTLSSYLRRVLEPLLLSSSYAPTFWHFQVYIRYILEPPPGKMKFNVSPIYG